MSSIDGAWVLSAEERQGVVNRAAIGIASMCFFSERTVSDLVADKAANSIESKAYARAQVESRTTTGCRPRAEVERAYLRIISEQLIESVRTGCASVASEGATTVTGEAFDLSATGREFVTKELAEQLLEPLLRQGASVSSMRLSTKSIGLDSAPVVAAAIGNVAATLTHADVSDIIAGRPEAEVLMVIRTVSAALGKCALADINISDNALGEKGVRAFSEAITGQASLRALSLQNIGCSVHACAAVAELVRCNSLERLHLFNNMSADEGAAAIATLLARSPAMKDFKMASSRVGLVGGQAIASALASSSSLLSLDLTDNPMEPAVAPALSSLITAQKSLQTLILNDLGLQNEGIAALARALADPATCPHLVMLELALNEISREVTPALAAALQSKRKLRRVNLSDNELECAGAVHVAVGLYKSAALEELDLRTNQIGKIGALEVAKCCCVGKEKLARVEMDDNMISEEGLDEMRVLFSNAFPGRDLLGSLDENDEDGDPDDADVLEDAKGALEGLDELDLDLGNMAL